jgi:hypothetical protein
VERFADPETGTGFTPAGLLRLADAREAVRDPSTSFTSLTPVRMTKTARESKNSQAIGKTKALRMTKESHISAAWRIMLQ